MWTPYTVSDAVVCLVERALKDAGCAEPTRRYVSAGTVAYDTCGQLTAGPYSRIFRSVSFPTEEAGEEECYVGSIVVPMQVVWTVCAPSKGPGRIPVPSEGQLDDAAAVALRDGAIIWNALSGELPDDEWERAGLSQDYIGPSGGIIGIVTRMQLGVDSSTWCLD